MIRKLVFWSGLIGALLFAVTSIIGGLQIEGYSFISQYISESFAIDVPNAIYLRYAYFLSGVLLVIFGLTIPYVLPKSGKVKIGFLLFALFYGLGNITVALFPCDSGCPTDIGNSSMAQILHNTSAFLTYTIVPFCLVAIGFFLKQWPYLAKMVKASLICGTLSLLFVVILFREPQGAFIGVFQRIIEANFLIWVVYCSFQILKKQDFLSEIS